MSRWGCQSTTWGLVVSVLSAFGPGCVPTDTPPLGTTDCSSATEIDVTAYSGGGLIEAGSCYLVNRDLVIDGGELTVEAGATLQFNANIAFIVRDDGRLRLSGTEDAPVVLMGQEESAGFWKGLNLRSSGAANVLDHFVIAHAGSRGWSGAAYSTASIFASASSGATMTNGRITTGGGHGFIAERQTEVRVSGCTFELHDQGAYVHPDVAQYLSADNAFVDNVVNVVRVGFSDTDDLLTEQTWQNVGVPWRIEKTLDVLAPLTLAPGAVVEFNEDIALEINEDGRLIAVGTAEAPITLTGVEKTRGYWQGIQVESRGSENALDHVVFEFAGSKNWTGAAQSAAGIRFEQGSRMSITNSTLRQTGNFAIWAADDVVFPAFEDNIFEQNAGVVHMHPNTVGQVSPNNTFTDNDDNTVRVTHGSFDSVTQAATWRALPVHYLVADQTQVKAALTIEAGATLEFLEDALLEVKEEGSLTAIGTEAAPIVFTARAGEETAGFWGGIEIGTRSAANLLEYVTIQYAGSKNWYGGDDVTGALHVPGGSLSITQSTIADIIGWGIDVRTEGTITDCAGTTFENLTGANVKGSPAGVCM